MLGSPASIASLVANWAWARSCRSDAMEFGRALNEPANAQRQLLDDIVRRNEATAFGRAMRFDLIRSVRDFRERVPLSEYGDYTGYIERIRSGESAVLTAEPVERLVPSSGSTAGRKLVPFTRSLRREFQRAIGPWVADMFARNPELMSGPSYWSISPALPESREGGAVPIGFDDDSEYLGRFSRRAVRQALAVPAAVRNIADVDSFRLVTLLFLLRARALRVISVWHPSFLSLLCGFMAERWEDLLRLLADGFPASGLHGEWGIALARKAPSLARELEAADPGRPETIWPRLGCISCWADGQSAGAVAELKRLFPRTPIEPKGLLATEAFVSVPFRGARPLAIRSHYFEFIDASGAVSGVEDLRLGETYSVVVTSGGGLYRYRMHDLVRVEGFVARTPSIVFVGREDRVSDFRGEKLSEGFVASVLRSVFGGEERIPEFVMLAPESVAGGIGYVLFVHTRESMPDELAGRIDAALSANPHYDWARKLGQLAPVEVCEVGEGAHGRVVAELQQRGQLLGGIKASCLRGETGWRDVLAGGWQG